MTGDRAPVRLPADDRLDIQELFARYAWGLSLGDPETVVACFTDDGYLLHPPQGRCTGHEAIRALLADMWYTQPGWFVGRQHLGSHFVVEPESQERVGVRAFWTIAQHSVQFGTDFIFRLGHWDNVCVKRAGEWRFEAVRVVKWLGDEIPWAGNQAAFGVPLRDAVRPTVKADRR